MPFFFVLFLYALQRGATNNDAAAVPYPTPYTLGGVPACTVRPSSGTRANEHTEARLNRLPFRGPFFDVPSIRGPFFDVPPIRGPFFDVPPCRGPLFDVPRRR